MRNEINSLELVLPKYNLDILILIEVWLMKDELDIRVFPDYKLISSYIRDVHIHSNFVLNFVPNSLVLIQLRTKFSLFQDTYLSPRGT